MPRFRALVALGFLAACAKAPEEPVRPEEVLPPPTIGALPATYANKPACAGCLALTVTLRPDNSFLAREQLGASEFYDFGKWRLSGATLELAGGRDARTHPLRSLTRKDEVEVLRGPFRLVGLYDRGDFKDCLTGLSWRFAPSRSAERLAEEAGKDAPQLVAIDARLEGAPEQLVMQRPAVMLHERACPTG